MKKWNASNLYEYLEKYDIQQQPKEEKKTNDI